MFFIVNPVFAFYRRCDNQEYHYHIVYNYLATRTHEIVQEMSIVSYRFHAVCGLLDLHRGEVVEVPTDTSAKWSLFYLPCLSGGHECLPDQFALGPHYRAPKLSHFDKQSMRRDIQDRMGTAITDRDLAPDQGRSRNRMFIPCRGTTQWAWVRAGNVITLGELFHELFHLYTSREIYNFYLSLDILAVKQKKVAARSRKRCIDQT